MAPLIPHLGTRRKWVVNCTPQPLPPGKKPLPIENEGGWASLDSFEGCKFSEGTLV